MNHTHGSGMVHITRSRFDAVPVAVPPIPEQARIVDILEGHLSRLDAAAAYIETSASRIDLVIAARLHSLLGDVHCLERQFNQLLRAPLANGRSVRTRHAGFPVLRLTALRDGTVDLQQRKGGDWSMRDAERFLLAQGDFLIARGNGSLHLVGGGALVRQEPDLVAFPDTVIRARPDTHVLNPDFLSLVWNSGHVREQIELLARTSAGIYKVNQQQLGSIRFPVPSILDQELMVKNLTETVDGSRALRAELTAVAGRGGALRRSLLAAAFSGKLTGRHTDAEIVEELTSGEVLA